MALQLWMPLMGDLRNQGLGSYSISTLGSISWVNGKLGATAMKAGDGTQIANGIRIEDTFTELLNGPYSVSVWVKPYGQHIHYNGSIFSSGNWNTAKKRWAFGVSQDNTKVDVLCSDYNTYVNCTVPVNEWTHLVCTCGSDRIVKLYKNGEYVTSVDRSAANVFDSDNTFTCIGRESYASGYFSFNGALQDFRLYDHALSELEIKHLAQGLIFHYPLNRNGWGQENLLSGNNAKITTWTNYMPNSVILSGDGYDNKYTLIKGIGGWEKIFTDAITVTNGNTYTLSFDYSVEQNYTGYSGQFGLSVCTTSQAKYGADTDVITKVNFGTVQKSKSRTSVTFTATSNTIYLVANGGNINDGQENISFYISYIKLEEGSIATPWCPNSSDAFATTIGLNSTTEYDCSGFCNNGIRYGTFNFNSETPKYAVSTQYNGTDNTLKIPFNASVWPDNFTMSIWFRKDELGSKSYETLFGGPSGFEMDTRSGSSSSLSIYMASTRGGNVYTGIEFGKWYMVTLVNDGTNELYYINGELVKTIAKKSMPVGNYWIGSWNSATSQNYKGLISDARIYATALSAADVKSLYQNCATIDPDGTIRGQIRS